MKRNSLYIEETDTRRKDFKRSRFLAVLALFAAVAAFFSSCTNEPIFATIENEIELRDPSLEGTVPSLVQYNDYLYACNGNVKRKLGRADPGSWEEVSRPGGLRCAKLVVITDNSNNQTLYGLFQNSDSDWSRGAVYEYDGSNWTLVTNAPSVVHQIGPAGDDAFYAIVHTGSAAENNASTSFAVYKYNGSNWTTLDGSLDSAPIGMGGDYIVTKYRAYEVNSNSNSISVISATGSIGFLPGNEYDIMGMCVNGDNLYVLTDDYLWHYNGSTWTGRTSTGTSSYDGFGAPAYWSNPDGGYDLVLIPLEEGYREVAINSSSGQLSGTGTAPGTGSPSTVSASARSQYRSSIDDYAINFMYVVTNDSSSSYNYLPSGCSYAVYASVGHYKYSGLWGYYGGYEEEWNRE